MNNFIDSLIDWEKFDATSDISNRLHNSVSKDYIEKEVEIWNKQLQMLEPLNYDSVKKELISWDISMPKNLSEDNLYETYSRLISYKTRLGYLMAISRSRKDTCENAIKYLEDLAPGAFSGTGDVKKAQAAMVKQPFVHLKNQVSRADNFINQIHNSVVFCANQIDLVIKERQSRAKFNYKLGHSGEELFSSRGREEEINIEEDGDIFQPVKISGKNN